MNKADRNDENIRQVVAILETAGYRSAKTLQSQTKGDVEFWVGPGPVPVIILHLYSNDDGFELYAPITQSNRMDETLDALRRLTGVHS